MSIKPTELPFAPHSTPVVSDNSEAPLARLSAPRAEDTTSEIVKSIFSGLVMEDVTSVNRRSYDLIGNDEA